MEQLQTALGYTFGDRSLLEAALTHRSYAEEHQIDHISARQAFLGDALLLGVVTRILYHEYPELEPGEMTLVRSKLVSRRNLAVWARELGLGEALLLGKGEEQLGGWDKGSILAESMEAVLAAMALDGGRDDLERLVRGYFDACIDQVFEGNLGKSAKAILQEFTQRRNGCYPTYKVIEESGLPHEKHFVIEVQLNGEPLGRGSGCSKKQAEQAAAREACRDLGL